MQRGVKEGKYKSWKLRNAPYLIAMVLAFVMVMVVAPEKYEGNAMDPTIKDGQVLVVSKTSYSSKRGEPDKGKLIIMEKTAAENVSKDNIVARVVGLPGDKVKISNGKVLINGKEYVTESGIKGAGIAKNKTYKLKENQVFLLSDNRDEDVGSTDDYIDSRNDKLGPVDMHDIKGNVLFRIWPFSDFGGIE